MLWSTTNSLFCWVGYLSRTVHACVCSTFVRIMLVLWQRNIVIVTWHFGVNSCYYRHHDVLIWLSLLSTGYYLHMLIGKVLIYRLLCFRLFVFCVCTVTNFSAEDITGGVKFCTVVHRCPRRGISHFGEHCSPRSPKSEESVAWPALGSLGAGVRTGHA